MNIPQYKPLINRETLAKEVSDYILSDGYFTEYKKTQEFEEKICAFLGVEHCCLMNNGTISLSLALLAYDIGPGDLVLVPNITMIATSNAAKLIGARVMFVDVDPDTMCLDLEAASQWIKAGYVKAVMYVTLNGRSHSLQTLMEFNHFCLKHNVALIMDNAQSYGSYFDDGEIIASLKHGIGSFSFSMPKIITTGQGGCLVTNHNGLYNKIKKLKDFGRESSGIDVHNVFGINSKFTEIQAIMGLNQMNDIGSRISTKRRMYDYYYEQLKNINGIKIKERRICETPWFVDIYVQNRLELIAFLMSHSIQTRCIYPELSKQKVNNNETSFSISSRVADTGLWLPSSLNLALEEIKFVCDKIGEFYV